MLEAVLLVGGQGTRLRPLTFTTPKPMLPVAGVPFLLHQILKLRDSGVGHIVLATSYRSEIFVERFGDGGALQVELSYVDENEPLGTGGAIRNAATALRGGGDSPVIVLNGDVVSGHSLVAQVAHHERAKADLTLHLVEVEDARAYGCVPTDEEGRVLEFLEKLPHPVTRWINAGAYVFRRSVINAIPAGQVVSVERDTFPQLLRSGAIVNAWKESSYWIDVGTPATLLQCSADLVRGIARSSAVPGPSGEALLLEGSKVAAGAEVRGGSVVGPDAVVGEGALVDGAIVMSGAIVGAGAAVRRSVLGRGAVVGENASLLDCVLGDEADVAPDVELPSGTSLAPREHYEPSGALASDG